MLAATDCTTNPIACGLQTTGNAINAATSAVDTVTGTVDFWSDPWGNAFKALQSSAHSLAETVIPALGHAALPDLSVDWFLHAYAISFALAIFVAVFLVGLQFVRTARGEQGGRDLAESVGMWFPLFLYGTMFGPLLGTILVEFSSALTDVLVQWGVAGSADQITATMTTMLSQQDASGLAGGAVVGVGFMLAMIIGLVLVVIMLVLQLVVLYASGFVLPLGLVWMIDGRHRSMASRIVWLWAGVLASRPLLFLGLGGMWSMVATKTSFFAQSPTLDQTVQLLVTVIVMLLVGLSPWLMTKFMPVIPWGSPSSGPSLPAAAGASTLHDAVARYGSRAPDGADEVGGSSSIDERQIDSVAAPSDPAGPPGATSMGPGSLGEVGGAEGAAAGAGEAAATTSAAESSTGTGAVIGAPVLAVGAQKAYQATTAAHAAAAGHLVAEVESHNGGET